MCKHTYAHAHAHTPTQKQVHTQCMHALLHTFTPQSPLSMSNLNVLSVDLSGKQDTLTPGTNITIANNTISASNFISSVNPANLSVTNGVLAVT